MASKVTLLIDGDHVLHRACVAVEEELRFDDEFHILFSRWSDAWHNVRSGIETLKDRFDTESAIVCLSDPPGGPYWRSAVWPAYKAARATTRKPLAFGRAREELERTYKTVKLHGLEADDVMGILGSRNPDTTIICSVDKDMKTVPATLFREDKVMRISEAEADYWHLYQTLVGDTTDGYPGCPGVGPVKAANILALPDEVDATGRRWAMVVGAYMKAGLTEADALTQARVARILRDSDWDSEKKEPILWHPGS